MTEADKPEDKLHRSMDTTMALHGIFSTLSDRMMRIGQSFYNGELETQLTHSAVFPETSCQGRMVVTYVDNLVEYADLICSAGCKHEVEYHPPDNPDATIKHQREEFTITFDDVGFISGEYTNSDDGRGHFMRPQVFQPQPVSRGLRDEDIQDLH